MAYHPLPVPSKAQRTKSHTMKAVTSLTCQTSHRTIVRKKIANFPSENPHANKDHVHHMRREKIQRRGFRDGESQRKNK